MSRSLAAALLLFSTAAFTSDLKFARKIRDGAGDHAPTVYYFQGQRIRIDHRTEFGYDWKNGSPQTIAYGPRMSTIYQCDMHRVLELDFDHHQYTVIELDRNGAPLGKAKPAEVPDRGGKVKVSIETRDTGETRQMFGHTAHRFITTRKMVPEAGACAKSQTTTEDGWYIDIDPRPTSCFEMEQPKLQKVAFAVLVAGNCHDDYEIERTGLTPPPFAIEVSVTTNDSPHPHKQTNTVTELSSLPLDPQIFDLPTGYKHVEKLDNSPNLPWLLHARLMWQSVKSTVWGWTPWGH
jgi:hypothetical protein